MCGEPEEDDLVFGSREPLSEVGRGVQLRLVSHPPQGLREGKIPPIPVAVRDLPPVLFGFEELHEIEDLLLGRCRQLGPVVEDPFREGYLAAPGIAMAWNECLRGEGMLLLLSAVGLLPRAVLRAVARPTLLWIVLEAHGMRAMPPSLRSLPGPPWTDPDEGPSA